MLKKLKEATILLETKICVTKRLETTELTRNWNLHICKSSYKRLNVCYRKIKKLFLL